MHICGILKFNIHCISCHNDENNFYDVLLHTCNMLNFEFFCNVLGYALSNNYSTSIDKMDQPRERLKIGLTIKK